MDDECLLGRTFQLGGHRPVTRKVDSGFSLVETLMALVVTASSMLALLGALGAARSIAAEARVREAATRLAEALIIEAEHADPARLPNAGSVPGERLSWHRRVQALPSPPGIMRIDVSVDWQAGRRTGYVALTSHYWAE